MFTLKEFERWERMARPKQTDPQFKLRLTPDLKAAIEQGAAKNNRSMNAEIIDRLESSLRDTIILPAALARRVGSYAREHGRTLSEEVVRVLEQKFPEPRSPDERFAEVLAILASLQKGAETNSVLSNFSVEVLRTLREISNGDMKVDPETQRRVSESLESWEAEMAERSYQQYTNNMDPEELDKFDRTGDDSILVDPTLKDTEK